MTWIWIALAVGVVLAAGTLFLRRGSRNSGAPRARDVDAVNHDHLDAHVARTQHHGNIHGSGGGGLPF